VRNRLDRRLAGLLAGETRFRFIDPISC